MKQLTTCILALAFLLCLCGCKAIKLSADEYLAQAATPTATPDESAEAPGASPLPTHSPEPTTTPAPGYPNQPQADNTHSAAGYVDGDRYINAVYGFSATLPEGWAFSTDKHVNLMYSQVLPLEFDYIRSKGTERYLVVCSQYPLLTSTTNPNIIIAASDAYTDYIFELYEPLLDQMQTAYVEAYQLMGAQTVDVDGDPSVMINGKQYMLFSIVSDFGGYIMYQHIYCTLVGSKMLTVTHTYFQVNGKAIMDAFMKSIVYD